MSKTFKEAGKIIEVCLYLLMLQQTLVACGSNNEVKNVDSSVATPLPVTNTVNAKPTAVTPGQSPTTNIDISAKKAPQATILAPFPVTPSLKTEQLTISARPIPSSGWEKRWLQSIPCKPPCWEGITPGVSKEDEVRKLISSNLLISSAEVSMLPKEPYKTVTWYWVDGSFGGELRYTKQTSNDDGVITYIHPSYPIPISFKEVIAAFGEPDTVIARAMDEGLPNLTLTFRVIYRKFGLILTHNSVDKKPEISANMVFQEVIFSNPTKKLPFEEGLQVNKSWQGFKDFYFYCDGDNFVCKK